MGALDGAAVGLLVGAAVGAVRFTDVQPSGKPRMTAAAWARGRGVQAGDLFDAALPSDPA